MLMSVPDCIKQLPDIILDFRLSKNLSPFEQFIEGLNIVDFTL